MSKVMVGRNTLIAIILVACLVCCVVSVGVSTLVVNSGANTATGPQGEKGDKGDAGAVGLTGATGQAGATGSTGVTGATGASGANGATWYSGAGQPAAALGATGDYYLDTLTNAIYRKDVTGTWIRQTNMQLNNKADYDSGWVNINSLAGQNLTLAHNLNTTNLQIQIQGKDANGNIHQKYLGLAPTTVQGWNQTYSETDGYIGFSIAATTDGGYIITGPMIYDVYSEASEVFLLKVDSGGYQQWCRTFNFSTSEIAYAVIQTSDGGYAITGYTYASLTDSQHIFLLKTYENGTLQWNTTFGNIDASGFALIQTKDGGYAITGQKGIVTYILKTYPNGTQQWLNTYGGSIGYSIIQTADNGFAVAGCVDDAQQYITHAYLVKIDANGAMQWNKTIGTNADEQYFYSIIATSDGGYVMAGNTYGSSDYTSNAYLTKTTSDGTLVWNKTYSGTDSRFAYSVVEAASGGYVMAGYGYSFASDDQSDFVLMKTAADGTLEWNKTYSNTEYDLAKAMVVSSDGGYAIVGYSYNTNSAQEYHSIFLVKTYSNGTLAWTETYGGSNKEYGYSVVATSDGGYAIAGYTREPLGYDSSVYLVKTASDGTLSWSKEYDCGVETSRGYALIQTSDGGYAITGIGDANALLLKTDVNGTLQWSKTFSVGEYDSYGYSVRQTSDGGYAIAGYTSVNDSNDVFIIKTDKNGAVQWNQTYGGSGDQIAFSMILTANGDYVIAGASETSTSISAMLLKVSANGTTQWTRVYNATDNSYGYSVVATAEGGYAIAGYTYSDVTDTPDVYLIKTDANGVMQWNQTYGGSNYEFGYGLTITADGGYAIAGYTQSMTTRSYDMLLVKTSSNGTYEWTKTFDGGSYERARAIVASPDGSFVLAGYDSNYNIILYKATVNLELGLANVATTNNTITVYRGIDDSIWQYVRIQIWKAD